MALSQLDDWQTAAVPLVTLFESLPRHRLDVIEAFLSSTKHGTFSDDYFNYQINSKNDFYFSDYS